MLKVEFYTPNGFYKDIEVNHINVITNDGQRGITENHMSIVSPLEISKLEAVTDKNIEYFAIGKGLMYFENKVAKIIVESIEDKNSIDIDRAMKAKERAMDRLNSNKSSVDIKRAQAALTKALNRIDVYNS